MEKRKMGEVLKSRRVQLGISQLGLAEMSETNPRTIFQIEKGTGNPSLDTLNRILDVLGLEITISLKHLDI